MQIPVLIEPVNGNGYRARVGDPFGITVEASTREETLEKLRQEVKARLEGGAEYLSMDVSAKESPWDKLAGIDKDEPMWDEWQRAIAEYRRKVGEDPDAL